MSNFKNISAFILLVLCLSSYAYAEERITSYNVYIKILEDSSLEIREQIDVIAEGNKIKRGIYRDFPTKYKDQNGFNYNVGFDVTSVMRDGKKEDYHTEKRSNGIRVYIGNKNRFVDYGKHSYILSFKTTRQLGFFKTHDELYFNAIGHAWDFRIDRAFVTVELPKYVGQDQFKIDGFTGFMGSKDKNFKIIGIADKTVSFATTTTLSQNQGFTIVVGWPKGVIKEPTALEKFILFIKDSFLAVLAILLCVGSLVVNLFLWLSYGVDPKKGVIYPRFAPPKDFAPYDLPFMIHMGYVPKCLSSAIVSCSIKGFVLIREESGILGFGSSFNIEKVNNKKAELDETEIKILSVLFRHGSTLIKCSSSNYEEFQAAKNIIENSCKTKLSKYYKKNLGWIVPGFIINIIAIFFALSYQMPALVFLIISIGIVSTIIFAILIKRYSEDGRNILDEIEGYKLYLDTAEKGHYDNIQFPQLTQERFESHLPFAVALGVEANWMSAFRKALSFAGNDPNTYQPTYYIGNNRWDQSSFFTDNSSGFNSAIASSSIAPGSSSGFSGGGGGGGSSGGGGGGGGGGGW